MHFGTKSTEHDVACPQPESDAAANEPAGPGLGWIKSINPWLLGPPLDIRFAGRIRREQLGAILRLTPAMMLANVANGLMLVSAFWQSDQRPFLLVWFLSLGLTIAIGLRAWIRCRDRPAPETVSQRGLRRAIWHAFTLGMIWAFVPIVLFDGADGAQRVLLSSLIAGMIAGGAFGLSTVPAAALAYSAVIAASAAGTLLTSGGETIYLMIALLLLTYFLIVARSIYWNAGLFVERLENQFDLEEQRELIGILLRDFEESASDWLWETDEDGRLQHISPRFAEVTARSAQALQGEKLVDLLCPADQPGTSEGRASDDRDLLQNLLECIEARLAFRDHTVHVRIGRARRFWSLSAKPVHDWQGTFRGYRGVGTDVTDKIRAERKLAFLAHRDPLTALANRSCLDTHLAAAFRSFRTTGEAFGLVCLDLDGFKAVNDSYGHAAGDLLLEMVGKRLRHCVRDVDVVARIGGDEFAVLQKADEQPTAALALAERIVATLASPFDLQGRRVTLGASVGIALGGCHGNNPMALLRHADLALYRAKRGGRGRFLVYQPHMAEEAAKVAHSPMAGLARLELLEPEPAS